MKIYRISGKSAFPGLESKVREVNKFWHPKAQKNEDIDVTDFMIGTTRYSSVEEALNELRVLWVDIGDAMKVDSSNVNLYNGWRNNITACANYLKDQHKKWENPRLF